MKTSKKRAKRKSAVRPDCHKCAYRGTIPGDAHSRCCHPEVKASEGQSEIASALLMLFGARLNVGGLPTKLGSVEVRFNRHGVENGWAAWPWNFDPVWLEACTGFKKVSK